MLKVKIERKQTLNPLVQGNFTEKKWKNYEVQFLNNLILKDEIKKN